MFFVSTVTCLRHKTVQAYLTNKDISEFEVSPEHVWEKLPYGDTGLFDAVCCEGDHPKKWLKILGPPND